MTVKEFAPDIKVAIAKSDAFVSRSMLLGRIMDDYDIDIAIAFTGDGKVSIRRKDNGRQESFSCSKIAQEFREGGGHEGAAGGFLNSRPEDEGDAAAITEIATALKSYFAKKST
jgi:hypothetical protein